MLIDKHTVVSLHYKLQRSDATGELVEETFGGEPLVFLFGVGQMIPSFEENLEGKKASEVLLSYIAHKDNEISHFKIETQIIVFNTVSD